MFCCKPDDGENCGCRSVALHILLGVLCVAGLVLVFGFVVMFLWNCLIPEIFSAPRITFWQGVGLLLLARVLTGRVGHGRGGFGHRGMRKGGPAWSEYETRWKDAWERKFGCCSSKSKDDADRKDSE